ncbi:MAG: hypothetical protein PF489_04660 [Salinivirgaceae bacterium]|nr:hypothetical protein [Salinivirgaceae bacterium]
MKNHFRFLITVFLSFNFFISAAQGQIEVTGLLQDQYGRPISFASVTTSSKANGTISDLSGSFHLRIEQPDSIYIYYLGFESFQFYADTSMHEIIKLVPKSYRLDEVQVFPGINPADTIMQHVIQYREKHNPLNLNSYKHMAYHKFRIEVNRDTLLYFKKIGILPATFDGLLKFSEEAHLFVTEAVTETTYSRPGQPKENVLTTHVAGFDDPSFAMIGSQLQSLSCYDDFFSIGTLKYVNPVSPNSWKRYLFLIQDTINDPLLGETMVITFRPRVGTSFNALFGMLYIHIDDFAVQRIVAQPASQSSRMGIVIKQEYKKADGQYWFPHKLQSNLYVYQNIIPNLDPVPFLVGVGSTDIINPQINTDLPRKLLGQQFQTSFTADANRMDTSLFTQYRTDALTVFDLNAYLFMDTVMNSPRMRLFRALPKALAEGAFPIGYFDINLGELFGYNLQDRFQYGLSLMTNQTLFEHIRVGGKVIHAPTTDHLYYAARGEINPFSSGIFRLRYEYRDETIEKGGFEFYEPYRMGFYNSRQFVLPALNYVTGQQTAIELEYPRNTNFRLQAFSQQTELSHTALDTSFGSFHQSALRFDLRFAPGEELTNMGNYRVRSGFGGVAFNLSYERGLKYESSDVSYSRYLANVKYSLATRFAGNFRIMATAGYVEGQIPLQLAFNGRGSAKMPLYEPGVFFTMPLYKFFHTGFVQSFFMYEIPIFVHHQNIKYSISTQVSMLHGENENLRLAGFTSSATMGYYEVGLMGGITDPELGRFILGAYYRIGEYAVANQFNNFSLILGFTTDVGW